MSNQGFVTPLILIVIVAIAVSGIGYYYISSQNQAVSPAPIASPQSSIRPATSPTQNVAVPPGAGAPAAPIAFSGSVLAGTTAPLLDFTSADFEAVKSSNKLVVLYFYANWCPICREEFPKMEAAFNQLNNPNVVGFRVNYNDSQTDDAEKALAREHGVAYQHTKVFVKNAQQVLKSPETWETARYLTEIGAHD